MKLAKFALACDGERVTSLEQLKEHFNLLDILEHYQSQTLHRWLRSRVSEKSKEGRECAELLQGVEGITATTDAEILNALCGVFGIEESKESIQDMLEAHKKAEDKQALEAEKEALKVEIASLKAQIQTLQSPPPLPA
ncbi:hypothetical protein NHP21005_15680 [Helicobacter sp. NHP21005]|uniref:hypothetical protein n=1 Tax=Helicobacter felistomachi TaxID=3040201 RepID=UPI0025730FA1|nr:hypothetical protein [Helicobacter sp. NHP21005]BEG57880.1 hypothetical protein NHP21005_15680 [Helicobacter sp. NHP21005]